MFNQRRVFEIILSGGGTGGSVSPLLGVLAALRQHRSELHALFLGTRQGPERTMVTDRGVAFRTIPSGKFRRYFSWRNGLDVFRIVAGFALALWILWRAKAKAIVTAGSHAAVPVAWAGWVLGVPVFVHQQDVVPGLANRLMAPVAYRVTTTFRTGGNDFPRRKTVHTGNPIRADLLTGQPGNARRYFHLSEKQALIVCLGGGTGASTLNEIILAALPGLLKEGQVIHSTGVGKAPVRPPLPGYMAVPFLGREYPDVLAAADLVVSRAGLATLTELAALGKLTILFPLPNTHQEVNAEYFNEQGAVTLLRQGPGAAADLVTTVHRLLHDQAAAQAFRTRLRLLAVPDAAERIARLVLTVLPARR